MATETFDATLRLGSREDVADLVADLRRALKQSHRNGGTYGVYRRADDGRVILAVEVRVGLVGRGAPCSA